MQKTAKEGRLLASYNVYTAKTGITNFFRIAPAKMQIALLALAYGISEVSSCRECADAQPYSDFNFSDNDANFYQLRLANLTLHNELADDITYKIFNFARLLQQGSAQCATMPSLIQPQKTLTCIMGYFDIYNNSANSCGSSVLLLSSTTMVNAVTACLGNYFSTMHAGLNLFNNDSQELDISTTPSNTTPFLPEQLMFPSLNAGAFYVLVIISFGLLSSVICISIACKGLLRNYRNRHGENIFLGGDEESQDYNEQDHLLAATRARYSPRVDPQAQSDFREKVLQDKFSLCEFLNEGARLHIGYDELLELAELNEMDKNLLISKAHKKDYICPVSLEIMQNPVYMLDGYFYERLAIAKHIQFSHADENVWVSPMTGESYALDTIIDLSKAVSYVRKQEIVSFLQEELEKIPSYFNKNIVTYKQRSASM